MTVSTAGQAPAAPTAVPSTVASPRHGRLRRTIATFPLLAGLALAVPAALAQDFTIGAGQTVVVTQMMNSVGDRA